MSKRCGSFPTLKEIAEETGYSMMTVSRALNHPELVQETTRDTILSAARERKYYPNSVARALSSGKTSIIYVYIPQDYAATNPFFMQVVAGLGETLGEYSYSMLIKRSWYEGEVCDGIVLMGLRENDILKAQNLAESKNVIVFGHVDKIDSIDVNNFEGMRLLTSHVLKRGRKHPMLLSIDEKRPFVHDRECGFLSELPLGAEKDIYRCANEVETAYNFMVKTFGNNPLPYDAICCASDDMALGVIRYCRDQGLRVPEDISIGGFDGLGKEQLSLPNITTIHQPIYEIGKALAKRLVTRITSTTHLVPTCEFVAPKIKKGGTA